MSGKKNVIRLCLAIFLGIVIISPAIFSAPSERADYENLIIQTENQTAATKEEKVVQKKFDELDQEYQEKARRLGYKEGDMVELRQDASGKLTILPPPKEIMTPEKMREKILAMASEKIVQKMTDDDVQLKATIAMDLTGYFTILTKFENLQKAFQEEAQKQGYKRDGTVEIQVDATTWEISVLPQKKEKKLTGKVLEIIPAKEEGAPPSYRCVANFEDLPEELQKLAKAKGYKKDKAVRFIYHEATKKYEILPQPLLVGLPCKWEDLTSKEQKKALKIGYKEGDTVWKTSDSKGRFNIPGGEITITVLEVDGELSLVINPKGMFNLARASDVKEDPLLKITHVILEQNVMTGDKIFFRCTARFEDLSKPDQVAALASGYKPGDEVLLYYDTRTNTFEIKRK